MLQVVDCPEDSVERVRYMMAYGHGVLAVGPLEGLNHAAQLTPRRGHVDHVSAAVTHDSAPSVYRVDARGWHGLIDPLVACAFGWFHEGHDVEEGERCKLLKLPALVLGYVSREHPSKTKAGGETSHPFESPFVVASRASRDAVHFGSVSGGAQPLEHAAVVRV